MDKSIIKLVAAVTTTFLLAGCGTVTGNSVGNVTNVSPKDVAVADESDPNTVTPDTSEKNAVDKMVPVDVEEIPSDYFNEAQQQGNLEELYYDTFESFSYDEKTYELTKRAIVYLPYGYSEDEKYDVFYLMHGGWGNETTTLGTPGNEGGLKNVIDNAIENGDMKPIIIVCPTYNNANENGQDSDSFSLAMQLTRNYHNELVNDLLPAVEGKYSTFAEGTSPEELAASRNHRSFGGFSMGSVTTWRTFEYCMDYFRNYLPMSCGTSLDDEEIWKGAEGFDKSDYFVYIMTGTDDFAYSYDNDRAQRAVESEYFADITAEENGNFIYRIKEGYSHDGRAAMEYTYNGMKYFFGKKNIAEISENNSYVASYTAETTISDVINDPAFNLNVQADAAEGNLAADNFGRLLFPANTGYYSGTKLNNLSMTWYGSLDTKETVEIVNTLKTKAEEGDTIFFDIYSDEEKKADSDKEDTGLFFFRGKQGAKTAICNAGGGFVYVGAMQDSFPHALELSKMGYNAFALIYRPGWDTAMEDLGRALSFLYDHAEELDIDMEDYSLWGGSAGARMAATLGNSDYLHYYTGRTDIPQTAAVIMQYTGYSETSKTDAPTYACVGTRDGIANWQTMENRLDTLTANYGIPTEFHSYEDLGHGFGLGTGTVAEGWINDAVAFWETQIK